LPITLPEGVEVNITDTNLVKVKGKLGELEQLVDPAITVKVEEGKVVLDRATEKKIIRQNMGFIDH